MKDIFSDTYAKTFDIVDSDKIKMYEIHAKVNHVIESQYLGKSREKKYFLASNLILACF